VEIEQLIGPLIDENNNPIILPVDRSYQCEYITASINSENNGLFAYLNPT
jgi:hypothetical protein